MYEVFIFRRLVGWMKAFFFQNAVGRPPQVGGILEKIR